MGAIMRPVLLKPHILIQFWFLKQRLIVLWFQGQNPEKGKLEQYSIASICRERIFMI